MSVEIKEVITNEIDGNKCVMLTDAMGNKWINLEPLGEVCGYKNPATSIRVLYNRHKNDFLNCVISYQSDTKGRPRLFFNREGVIRIKMLSRKFRTSTSMDQLIDFLTQVDSGELKVIDQEGVAKLQQQIQKPVLGQDLSHVIARLDRIEHLIKQQNGLALPQKNLMDVPRKKIIAWLLDNAAKDFGVPGYEIWWDFSNTLGVSNYGKQPKSMFPKMLQFFFEINPKLLVRAYNWYMSTANPKEEIQNMFLRLFDPQQANLDDFSEDELSEYT